MTDCQKCGGDLLLEQCERMDCPQVAHMRRTSQTTGWRPITEPPPAPMPALLFRAAMKFWDASGVQHDPDHARGEAVEVAYWTGTVWRQSCTNHDVFEPGQAQIGDPDAPTHWAPIPEPPHA